MTNLFALLSQPYSNRILTGDRPPLSYETLYRERRSSMSSAPEEQELALSAHHTHKGDKPSLIISVLLTIGWLVGLTVMLAGCSSNSVSSDSPTPSSLVSSFSSKDINNYANAVLAIEPSRQAAYKDLQEISNGEKIPDIICTKKDTVKPLDQGVQDIVVKYCKQAKQLIKDRGLTISKFNDMTLVAESSPALRKQIQSELLRLQR